MYANILMPILGIIFIKELRLSVNNVGSFLFVLFTSSLMEVNEVSIYKKYVGASDEEVLKMVESDFGPMASEHWKVHGYLSLKQAKEYSRIHEIRD